MRTSSPPQLCFWSQFKTGYGSHWSPICFQFTTNDVFILWRILFIVVVLRLIIIINIINVVVIIIVRSVIDKYEFCKIRLVINVTINTRKKWMKQCVFQPQDGARCSLLDFFAFGREVCSPALSVVVVKHGVRQRQRRGFCDLRDSVGAFGGRCRLC